MRLERFWKISGKKLVQNVHRFLRSLIEKKSIEFNIHTTYFT